MASSVFFENTRFFAPTLTNIKIGFPQMSLDTAHNARQLTSMQKLWINKSFCISVGQAMKFCVCAMCVNLAKFSYKPRK